MILLNLTWHDPSCHSVIRCKDLQSLPGLSDRAIGRKGLCCRLGDQPDPSCRQRCLIPRRFCPIDDWGLHLLICPKLCFQSRSPFATLVPVSHASLSSVLDTVAAFHNVVNPVFYSKTISNFRLSPSCNGLLAGCLGTCHPEHQRGLWYNAMADKRFSDPPSSTLSNSSARPISPYDTPARSQSV